MEYGDFDSFSQEYDDDGRKMNTLMSDPSDPGGMASSDDSDKSDSLDVDILLDQATKARKTNKK